MKVTYELPPTNLPVHWEGKIAKTGFLDTGGTVDNAAFTMCRVDIPERIIYVTGAMFWKVSEQDNVLFATIRNDLAKLHKINHYDMIGCETNNYGRTEIESLRREYGMRMIGINTVGKVTDKKKLQAGLSMDKEVIIQFTNSWRQNALFDPENKYKLGQIRFLKEKTPQLQKIVNELDTFVRKMPDSLGSTGRPKFGAEGSNHDDGVTSMLGNFHIIKTKIFKIFGGKSAVGKVPNEYYSMGDKKPLPPNVAVGSISRDIEEEKF